MKKGDVIYLRDDDINEYRIVECLSTTEALIENIWTGKTMVVSVERVRKSPTPQINFGP